MEKKTRKRKYKKEFCEKLIDHMAKGYTFDSFAGIVNVNRKTIYRWLKEKPDFKNAREIGRPMQQHHWEKIGQGLATGQLRGNATVWVFTMKNCFGWRENKVQEEAIENNHKAIMELIELKKKELEGKE